MDSLRFDHLTKVLNRNTSRRQAIKGLAAAAIGGTLGLSGIRAAFADTLWNQPVYGTIITQLVVRIVTGTDDLRQGSQAVAYIGLDDGSGTPGAKQTLRLGGKTGGLNWNDVTQSWDGWPDGTFIPLKFYLWNSPYFVLPVNYIRWFYIHFQSGSGISPDNWNMNAIRVLYPRRPDIDPPLTTNIDWSQYYQLFYGSGPDGSSGTSTRPLKRFANI